MGVMGKLAGQTIFITGASRGIGEAIAQKCARDGANIVIAAKTTVPHPKLPGTIYTAAKEIEEAGGQCLPCVVDIQNEDQVKQAVDDAVKKFGGIDILVNNASAIHITDTLSTPMKRYDLMHHVNTRGTFMCSKYCVPHLMKSSNPHILNISPPLTMQSRWFKDHVAYTMAKFGMSMCALGMAEEFRDDGIAVNTLWPKTAIFTAAMAMLGGGDSVKSQCRTPEIMADAAYSIFTKPSRSYTAQFLVDEDVLRQDGCIDFEKYACVKGSELLPDFFLDEVQDGMYDAVKDTMPFGKKEGNTSGAVNTGNAELDKALTTIQGMIDPAMVGSIKGIFKLDLKDGGVWYLNMKDGAGSLGQEELESGCQLTLTPDVFLQMVMGKVNPTTAFMTGKLKIKGDLPLATKLEKILKQARSKLELSGKTIFITGASRGIGKAIAIKCAKDGANIVIAAKTTVPHPKLSGTIYTAAKEIEEAGGQCLPCVVDIQNEDQVKQAVDDAVNKFGGIDILVNNASAIHITGTVDTPMKRYDLMHHINTRGTFLCSKYCVPHLMKSSNPHILNISPPLNMHPRWFKDHVAYTMAKFGMSMCALGMAEEFREDGIAVNTLWPQTGIYTAAVELLGGAAMKAHCRRPDIMADAAHSILIKPSRSLTGNFLIDEQFLRQEGCTDFEQYAFVKGAKLMTDYFVDDENPSNARFGARQEIVDSAMKPATINTGNTELDKALTTIRSMINLDQVSTIKGVLKLDFNDGGVWYLNLKHGAGSLGQEELESGCQLTLTPDVFMQMMMGKMNPTTAFMNGKLKIKGDVALATKLEKILKQARSKL